MALEDTRISHRLKLASLWTSLMFCYIYCDYFELYQPGKLQGMLEGIFGPLGPSSQGNLLIGGVMLLLPSLMIAVCTILPVSLCRVVNVMMGLLYTLIMAAVIQGGWYFYKLFAATEIVLSLSIAWLAYRWPKVAAT